MSAIKNVVLKVVGVTFTNEDTGISRQTVIGNLKQDSKIWLEREPSNKFDTNAIRVMTEEGQAGYIGKDYASILSGMIDGGRRFECSVSELDKYKDTRYLHILIDEVK